MSYIVGKYLTTEGLENIKNHKYVAGAYSKTDLLMENYWKWWVNFLPMSMAPNTVTLLGFLILLVSYILMALSDMSMTSYPPAWTWFLTAFGMFAFQTLDAVDGKQARRTDSSSPLGQLFDHGLDGISLSTWCLTFVSLFGCGLSIEGVWCMLWTWTPLFSLHLLEYYTGVFEYNIGGVDGTLGVLIGVMFSLFPSIFGRDFYSWKLREMIPFKYISNLFDLVGISNIFTRDLIMRDIGILFVVYIGVIFSILIVYHLVSSQKGLKMKMTVTFQLIQQMLCYVVLYSFDTKIEFIRNNIVLCYFMVIFMYNILQTKLVICLMSKSKFYPLHLEYIVFLIYFYFQFKYDGSYESERNLKYGFFVSFTILLFLYLRLFQSCISQLTEYLGIEWFSIKKKFKAD